MRFHKKPTLVTLEVAHSFFSISWQLIDLDRYSGLTRRAFPEVSEEAVANAELEKDDEDQEPLEEQPGYEEDYDEVIPDKEEEGEVEVVQDEEEEIIGTLE